MGDILNFVAEVEVEEKTMILGLVLLSVMMVVLTIGFMLLSIKSPLKRKILDLSKEDTTSNLGKSERLESTLESLAPLISPKSGKERESIRHKLMHAGYHDSSTLTFFYAIKILTTLSGVGLAACIFFFYPSINNANLIMIVLISVGLFSPNVVISHMASKRQRAVRAGVPDALDLLVVCTESGLGFNAALRRVANEMRISHPYFADELRTVCAKIKAGVEMSDAFDEMIVRTGLKEIQGLVGMLSHASRIGGSLAKTLRDYTEDFRDKRNQEVEEIAAKIPTKMIFPLLMFIWPCFFIVAVGPALISLSDAFQ